MPESAGLVDEILVKKFCYINFFLYICTCNAEYVLCLNSCIYAQYKETADCLAGVHPYHRCGARRAGSEQENRENHEDHQEGWQEGNQGRQDSQACCRPQACRAAGGGAALQLDRLPVCHPVAARQALRPHDGP